MSGCPFRCLYCQNPDTWKIGSGRKVTLDEAITEIEPYVGFLKTAGGVTISGGEPLVQAQFVSELLKRIKKDFGLHTALDTQGFLHTNVDDKWLGAVDLVLLDIKHIDPEKYLKLTGCALQPTLDFAERLVRLKKKMWIRYVLVPTTIKTFYAWQIMWRGLARASNASRFCRFIRWESSSGKNWGLIMLSKKR